MQTLVHLTIRRLAPALLLAAAATLGANAVGDPATASAEWDIGQYDNCMQGVDDLYMSGDIPANELIDWETHCCTMSGGLSQQGGFSCGAPPAVAASNTPSAPPIANADPDAGAAPKPTKKPPTKFPTAPVPNPAPVG